MPATDKTIKTLGKQFKKLQKQFDTLLLAFSQLRSAHQKLKQITKLFEKMHKILAPPTVTPKQAKKAEIAKLGRQLALNEFAKQGITCGTYEEGSRWWRRAQEHIKELSKQGKNMKAGEKGESR